jgi:predicted MFS family arabinose efflux permease
MIAFILVLGLTLSGEGMITISLTWAILEQGGQIVHLGIILSVMSILPLIVQRYSRALSRVTREYPLRVFAIVRAVGLVSIAILLLTGSVDLTTLYVFAAIFCLIIFISMQSIEMYISSVVLEGRLGAHQGSTMLQTCVQIGAFAGNAIGGFILAAYGFTGVMLAIACSLALGVLIPLFQRKVLAESAAGSQRESREASASPSGAQPQQTTLLVSLIMLGVLGVQLAAFNFNVPVIYYELKAWDAATFGLVSSAAGIGALLATFMMKRIRILDTPSS